MATSPFKASRCLVRNGQVSAKLYDSLFKETNDALLNALTVMALELLAALLLILLERQVKTQLPDGKYWNPSQGMKEMSANTPKTNAISERDIAMSLACETSLIRSGHQGRCHVFHEQTISVA